MIRYEPTGKNLVASRCGRTGPISGVFARDSACVINNDPNRSAAAQNYRARCTRRSFEDPYGCERKRLLAKPSAQRLAHFVGIVASAFVNLALGFIKRTQQLGLLFVIQAGQAASPGKQARL